MFAPNRLAYALRPGTRAPLLLAVVAIGAMFAATPFLIPEVAARYGVTTGRAGWLSVVQVGSFAAANFVLPRTTAPSVRTYRVAAVGLLVANVLSALPEVLWQLLTIRLMAGMAAGTLTWLAWSDAMATDRSMSAIAAAGPVTALVASPIVAAVSEFGDRPVYLLLALICLPLPFLAPGLDGRHGSSRLVSPSRSNRVLLAALLLLTLSGASFFVYAAAAARAELGLRPTVAAVAFSLNAGAGIIGARYSARHRRPGWWLATAGPAAAVTLLGGPVGYFVGMAWWGFAFWMGVPGVLQMLAARSLTPAERAGDAQGFMAVGRAIGPLAGGAFADADSFVALSLASGAGMVAAGSVVVAVQEGRDRLPPTRPRIAP